MKDLISRQAAIDILDAYQVMVENGEGNPYAWARLRMSELPPTQPVRKKGCKIVKGTGHYGYCACDQCGKPVHPEDRFCSKCGADFREEDA